MLLQVGGAVPTTWWELILTSSPETQFVLVVLVVFSIVSWYLIVLKWWQFRRMRQLGDRFLREVEKAPRLEDAYHAAMRLPPSPYNRLLREAIHFFSELMPGSLKAGPAAGAPKGGGGASSPPRSRRLSSRRCAWCSPRRSPPSATARRGSSRGSRRSAR